MTVRHDSMIDGVDFEAATKDGSGGAGHTNRSLTHSLDYTEEGLMPHSKARLSVTEQAVR